MSTSYKIKAGNDQLRVTVSLISCCYYMRLHLLDSWPSTIKLASNSFQRAKRRKKSPSQFLLDHFRGRLWFTKCFRVTLLPGLSDLFRKSDLHSSDQFEALGRKLVL